MERLDPPEYSYNVSILLRADVTTSPATKGTSKTSPMKRLSCP
jgi:hypothetical protein